MAKKNTKAARGGTAAAAPTKPVDTGVSPFQAEQERVETERKETTERSSRGGKKAEAGKAKVLPAAGEPDSQVIPNSQEAIRGPINSSAETLREAHGIQLEEGDSKRKAAKRPKGAVTISSIAPRYTLHGRTFRDDGYGGTVQPDAFTDEQWDRILASNQLRVKKASGNDADL